MSEIIPGTLVRMRVARQYASYVVGDVIAVPFHQGKELEAKRLAVPIELLVPPVPGAEAEPIPQRQPGTLVRK